jgi:hypothetical protein
METVMDLDRFARVEGTRLAVSMLAAVSTEEAIALVDERYGGDRELSLMDVRVLGQALGRVTAVVRTLNEFPQLEAMLREIAQGMALEAAAEEAADG